MEKKFEYDNEEKRGMDPGSHGEKVYLTGKGNQGWELVAVTSPSLGNSYVYYWKKEKK